MEHSKLHDVTWTANLKSELLRIYEETMDDRYGDGCTVNVKPSLHQKWELEGYGHYGLTPQDLIDQASKIKYDVLVTNFDKEFPQKMDGLRKVFHELEQGNDVTISDVVEFIKELDLKVRHKNTNAEEIERDVRQALELAPDVTDLSLIQMMQLLNKQLPVDMEAELIGAFQIFDEDDTGYITMAELDSIMSMHGTPLHESDLKTLKKQSLIFERNEQDDQKQISGNPEIDYRAFIKHFLTMINSKE